MKVERLYYMVTALIAAAFLVLSLYGLARNRCADDLENPGEAIRDAQREGLLRAADGLSKIP